MHAFFLCSFDRYQFDIYLLPISFHASPTPQKDLTAHKVNLRKTLKNKGLIKFLMSKSVDVSKIFCLKCGMCLANSKNILSGFAFLPGAWRRSLTTSLLCDALCGKLPGWKMIPCDNGCEKGWVVHS